MNHINPLKKVIDSYGMRQLALEIGVSYQAVQRYLKVNVASDKVIPICKATNYQVTPHELRPDIYPYIHDGLPEHLRNVA